MSLGVSDMETLKKKEKCALSIAAEVGQENIVRILVNGHLEESGGEDAISVALGYATKCGKPRVLQIHLDVQVKGKDAQADRTQTYFGDWPILFVAVACGRLRCIHTLLSNGADETKPDAIEKGIAGATEVYPVTDPAKDASILRMLKRGPAFRAKSWAWPDERESVPSTMPVKKAPPLGVRVYRPTGGRKVFTRLLSR